MENELLIEGLIDTVSIDTGLARYSDWAFTSSVVVLVAALLLLAVELAYNRSRKAETRELVGATVGPDSATPGVVTDMPRRPVGERVGKAGLALTYVGIGLLLACIVLRGLARIFRGGWCGICVVSSCVGEQGFSGGGVVDRSRVAGWGGLPRAGGLSWTSRR